MSNKIVVDGSNALSVKPNTGGKIALTKKLDTTGMVTLYENGKCVEPFKPGDRVEFCGIEAVVVKNYGGDGIVEIPGEGQCRWYWNFQGASVRRVEELKMAEEEKPELPPLHPDELADLERIAGRPLTIEEAHRALRDRWDRGTF